MTKDKNDLCVYCGKPLTWNNNVLYEYFDPIIGITVTLYCSKECLMKDNGLSEKEYNKGIIHFVFVKDKAKEK